MSLDERFRQRESAFQHLLDRIGSGSPIGGGSFAVRAAGAFGGESLRPDWTEPAPASIFRAEAVAALYEENQPPSEMAPSAPLRQDFDLAAHAERIRRALDKKHDADELRRLRRQCALLAHPDRAPDLNRAEAEKFMAEINAAIDEAIKSQTAGRAKP
jgi:hypothetical protein